MSSRRCGVDDAHAAGAEHVDHDVAADRGAVWQVVLAVRFG
jgi:hypothetical protein